jgi:nucleotide-binding universal stress UspA family protein
MAIRRLLFATDFSAPSNQAFELAVDLARGWRSELVVLHVIEPLALPEDFRAASSVAERLERSARAAVRRARASARSRGLRCHGLVRNGTAASVIVDTAERLRIGLIVLGTHGRGGISRFFMGSVAERVVRSAPCPALTVPTPRPAVPEATRARRRRARSLLRGRST